MIAILDYRAGNLTSVERALRFLGFPCEITASHERIRAADRIIFPGVGAAGKSMQDLKELGLDGASPGATSKPGCRSWASVWACRCFLTTVKKTTRRCLGILPGEVRLFPRELRDEHGDLLKIPHMGWNEVIFPQRASGVQECARRQ